jgi:hypothetical protein
MLGKLGVAGLLLAASGLWAQSQPQDLTVNYQKAGVDLRSYKQFLVKPLNLADTRLVPPPWVEKPDPKVWTLSRENQDFLRTTFASSVRTGIEESGQYKVVTAPTPGTLQLEVHLISLTPWASRGEAVETLGSGSLTFEAHVRDAQTSDLLAVFEGTQLVGKDYQENTAFNKATDLTNHFTTWGRNISRRLAARQAQ